MQKVNRDSCGINDNDNNPYSSEVVVILLLSLLLLQLPIVYILEQDGVEIKIIAIRIKHHHNLYSVLLILVQ